MKIFQVMAGGKHGGAETAFVDMCLAMYEAGEDIEVITRANAVRIPQLQKAGLPVHILPFGGALDVYTSWRLAKLIQQKRPSIIQTWMSRAAHKIPKIANDDCKVISRLGGYYKIKYFQNTDHFIVITEGLKQHLQNQGVTEDAITQIVNFAETETESDLVSRESLETPEDACVLLCLARLHTNKALDIAIEALKDLPRAYLWLAGEGPERKSLQDLAQNLGVAERVRFLGWRTDRGALLQAADICLFCSRVEPFGTVFAQAWSQKTPLIVSDAEGPAQFCRNEEDSLVVPKDNARAIVDAVQKLLGNSALQEKLVTRGYERYKAEFTKEKSVQAYLNFYQSLFTES